jgi:ribonuclease HI
VLGNPGHAS